MRDGPWRRARLSRAHLYLCTPLRPDLESFLDAVLRGGVDIVQLRDKVASTDDQLGAAAAFRHAADRHDALFIVNDDPHLALAAEADGVHVGQDDLAPADARQIVGPGLLVGRSTHSTAEIDAAVSEDCDYFAVGPVTPTPTKQGRPGIGVDPLRHATRVGTKPWFVTGGMAVETIPRVLDTGATRVVVVRALTHADDPQAAASAISAALDATPQPP